MSDKKLLEEGTIRRFMELANIKPVGNGLLEEKKKPAAKPAKAGEEGKEPVKEGYVDEVKMEEEAVEEAVSSMEEKYHEEGLEEAEGEMETAAPAEGGESGVRAALEDIKNGVDKLLGMIEGASDLGMEVEDEEEGGEEMGGEMPSMGGEEEAMKDEEGLAEMKHAGKHGAKVKAHKKGGKVQEAKKEEEESLEESAEEEEEALAEELTRRVAARLVAEMKKGGGAWGSKPPAAKKGSAPKSKGNASKSNWGTKKGAKGY